MRLSLNVDQETFDAAGREFEPIPEGKYKATVFEVTAGAVKDGPNKGKPRLSIRFRIVDGEQAVDGTKVGGRNVFGNINAFEGVSKKTGEPTPAYDLIDLVKALGGTAEDLSDIDTDDWLGQELEIRVAHKEKQRQVNGEWVPFNPPKYGDEVKGYRSLTAANTAAVSSTTVKTAGKAKANAGAFSL